MRISGLVIASAIMVGTAGACGVGGGAAELDGGLEGSSSNADASCGAFGCIDSGGQPGNPGPIAATLRGKITSAAGAIVAGATVTWSGTTTGSTMTLTDSTGSFSMNGTLPTGTTSTSFTVSATGFAPQVVEVTVKNGVTTYSVPAVLSPLQTQALSPTTSTTITIQLPGPGNVVHPATLTIPAGAATGTQVRVAPIAIGNSPGSMRAEGGPAGDALASLGMFYVEFVDANGNQVQAPTGTQVTLGAQTPPTIPNSDPFNAWTLNNNGNWANPTPMTAPAAATPAAPAPVPSFGYWNSDHAFRTACISGTLHAPSGACGGARLDLTGPDGIHSTDSSGADGSFCLVGPQGHTGTLNLTGGGTVSFPGQAGNCSVPSSCSNVGMFNISDTECQNGGGATDGGSAGDACPAGDFHCTDGACIAASLVCNGTSNCPDGSDENPSICNNQGMCCVATNDCPGETGSSCAATCCCCPGGQRCCADPTQGCCASP